MSNMKKWNYMISIVTLLLGAGVITMAAKLSAQTGTGDPGPGFWPNMLGIVMVGLAVLLAVSNTVKGQKEAAKQFALTMPGNRLVYLFMAVIVGYCAALYYLGFVIATLLFIPCAMWMLGVRSPVKIALTDVIVVATVYLVFRILLKTPLPDPIFMR